MTDAVCAVCFPHDDVAFVERVRTLIPTGSPPDEPLRATVEAMLRESYPLAVVSARLPFAALDARPTWYVYRDGGIGSAEAARDGLPAGTS